MAPNRIDGAHPGLSCVSKRGVGVAGNCTTNTTCLGWHCGEARELGNDPPVCVLVLDVSWRLLSFPRLVFDEGSLLVAGSWLGHSLKYMGAHAGNPQGFATTTRVATQRQLATIPTLFQGQRCQTRKFSTCTFLTLLLHFLSFSIHTQSMAPRALRRL